MVRGKAGYRSGIDLGLEVISKVHEQFPIPSTSGRSVTELDCEAFDKALPLFPLLNQ